MFFSWWVFLLVGFPPDKKTQSLVPQALVLSGAVSQACRKTSGQLAERLPEPKTFSRDYLGDLMSVPTASHTVGFPLTWETQSLVF